MLAIAFGGPASIALAWLKDDGPPYLFSSMTAVSVGDVFELAGQPFAVIRMCDEQEWTARQVERGCTKSSILAGSSASVCFFEAVTD